MTRTSLVQVAVVLAIVLMGTVARAQDASTSGALSGPSEAKADQPAAIPPAAAKAPLQLLSPVQTALSGNEEGARTEPITERYPNGKVKIERHVVQDSAKNYVNHGTYTMYDIDGKVLKTGEFRNGKQDGKWVQTLARDEGHLFSSGQDNGFAGPFTSEATFEDGQLHGVWTIKDSNGQNIVEWKFQHGVRDGQWTWWYPGGQKRLEANYRSGALNGDLLEWDRDGKQVSQVTYVDGKYLAPTVGWYTPIQKHFEGNYLRTTTAAEPIYHWWTATVTEGPITPAGKDERHGVWVSYHRNGNKQFEGRYDHHQPVGKFTWWYENGQKEAEGEYQNGMKSGIWVTWHANGLKESEGEYQDGNLTKWVRWTADGKVAETQAMSKDAPKADKKPRTSVGQRPLQPVSR